MIDPWEIKVDGFVKCKSERQRLSYLVSYAILAPSTHNSQPWRFLIGENFVKISPDHDRYLKHSDPNGRQMWLSIGCALENLLIASDFFGYDSKIEFDGRKEISINFERKLSGRYDDGHLIFSIPKRVTSRFEQKRIEVDQQLKKLILNNSTNNLKVDLIEDFQGLKICADETASGTVNAFDRRHFRKELARYLKNNFTKSQIGMPMYGMGIPDIASVFASITTRFINPGKVFAKKAGDLILNNTGNIFLISTFGDDVESWLNSGRVFQKSALIATRAGYSLSPLAASVEFGNREKLRSIISNANFYPQMFARLGIAEKSPKHSPRLNLKSVASYV